MKANRIYLHLILLANLCTFLKFTFAYSGFHSSQNSHDRITSLSESRGFNNQQRIALGNQAWYRWGYRPFRGYRWPGFYRNKPSYWRGYYGRSWHRDMNWYGWGGYRPTWYYRGYFYPQWYYGYYPWYYWYY